MNNSVRKSLYPRFSIQQLLAATAVIAIGCAALMNANDWWVSGLSTIVFGSLLVAIMGSIYCCDTSRAFAVGFALTGILFGIQTFSTAA